MDIRELITAGDFKKIEELFTSNKPVFEVEQIEAINQYKVEKHSIFDTDKRPDKKVYKDNGELDKVVSVARIGISFQELIVDRRVGFTLSMPVQTEATYSTKTENTKEKELVDFIDRIQDDNKMDFKNKEILRRMLSEMESAEVWYFVETGEVKPKYALRLKILSPDLGDNLYPLFDSTGDMIAFARGYKIKEGTKDIEHFDIYLPDAEYKYINRDNKWDLDKIISKNETGEEIQLNVNPVPNVVKKIMIIYHAQKKPEWHKVQSSIEREEEVFSNHADMNDYFGAPILAISGEFSEAGDKKESGKMLLLTEQAKAAFLALQSPPESIKMEIDNLDKNIYSLSQTPDISFSAMKGMGTIAQFTMKAFFIDAHMAVGNVEERFGIGLQRRLNLIKACIGTVIDTSYSDTAKSLRVKPKITPFLPENDTEKIDNLSVSVTAGIMSKETAIEQNPLVEDSDTEMERMKNDATAQLADTLLIQSKKTPPKPPVKPIPGQ